jgi:serine/threonine-protein kinase
VRGQKVDKRTDIWAFGCLLYELLTGQGAFRRETVADTLAAILDKEPDWSKLPRETPRSVLRLLNRCLAKDVHHRLHDMADVRIEIEDARAEGRGVTYGGEGPAVGVEPTPVPFWRRKRVWWGMAGLAIGAVSVLLALTGRWNQETEQAVSGPPQMYQIVIPSGATLQFPHFQRQLSISPDGESVVFAARQDGVQRLYLRRLQDLYAEPINGTEGAENPFFSSDSAWLGFFANGEMNKEIRKVRLEGGTTQVVCEFPWSNLSFGATWGPRGDIIFNPGLFRGLWKVPAEGGRPERILAPNPSIGAYDYMMPSFLPGGRSVLTGVFQGGIGTSNLGLLDLETGEVRTVIEQSSYGVYVPTGHIVFGRSGGVYAVRFDIETMTITGPEHPVIRDVESHPLFRIGQFAISGIGTLVYQPRNPQAQRELVRVDLEGNPTVIPAPPQDYMYPRFSPPDGEWIAVNVVEAEPNIWIINARTGAHYPLTGGAMSNQFPSWTADGRNVTYLSIRADPKETGVYQKAFDASGDEELLFRPTFGEQGNLWPNDWSPEGRALVGQWNASGAQDSEPAQGIAYLSLDDPAELKTLVPPVPGARMFGAAFSPRGDWVAYISMLAGSAAQVHLTPFPAGARMIPVTAGSPVGPDALALVWSPDGRRLYYSSGGPIMVVDVEDGPPIELSAPRILFESNYYGGYLRDHANFDIAPDGESFVMVRGVARPAGPTYLNVVTNWFEELRRLAPPER